MKKITVHNNLFAFTNKIHEDSAEPAECLSVSQSHTSFKREEIHILPDDQYKKLVPEAANLFFAFSNIYCYSECMIYALYKVLNNNCHLRHIFIDAYTFSISSIISEKGEFRIEKVDSFDIEGIDARNYLECLTPGILFDPLPVFFQSNYVVSSLFNKLASGSVIIEIPFHYNYRNLNVNRRNLNNLLSGIGDQISRKMKIPSDTVIMVSGYWSNYKWFLEYLKAKINNSAIINLTDTAVAVSTNDLLINGFLILSQSGDNKQCVSSDLEIAGYMPQSIHLPVFRKKEEARKSIRKFQDIGYRFSVDIKNPEMQIIFKRKAIKITHTLSPDRLNTGKQMQIIVPRIGMDAFNRFYLNIDDSVYLIS